MPTAEAAFAAVGPVEIPLTSLRNGRRIPHIVRIHGLGAIQTSIIVVMPYKQPRRFLSSTVVC